MIGEAETRVAELLDDAGRRAQLPAVMWLDRVLRIPVTGGTPGNSHHLAPDIDTLSFLDRAYLAQDPRPINGLLQANMVGARGCPYNCTFCRAAVSANPDVTIRTRRPDGILAEMHQLRGQGVRAFRFVDDLFLGARRVIEAMMGPFTADRVGDWARWDATGRINVLHRLPDRELDRLAAAGLREVALGIESGSQRILTLIDKRITPEMATAVVRRLTDRGIDVKGYFILGFPTETISEIDTTETLIHQLWEMTDRAPGTFTASVFEYRPYPGTPDWHRLIATGPYSPEQLLDYSPVDLTDGGGDPLMRKRDEFSFSINHQLSAAPIPYVRAALARLSRAQHQRDAAA